MLRQTYSLANTDLLLLFDWMEPSSYTRPRTPSSMAKIHYVPSLIFLLLLIVVGYNYSSLNSDYGDLKARYNSLSSDYNMLENRFQYVNYSLGNSQRMYDQLLRDYSRNQTAFQAPSTNQSIPVWTIQQNIQPNGFIAWGLLDTFVNHIHLRTNQTAQFLVMSIRDYARLVYGMPYVAVYNSTGTEFSAEVRLTQGCACYLLVIRNDLSSATALFPNVTATYAPTPFLTGVCSLS
jgi:hypothetical protein